MLDIFKHLFSLFGLASPWLFVSEEEANPNKDKRCLKIASISENLLNNQEMNKFTADKSASEITYSWTQKCIKAKDYQ